MIEFSERDTRIILQALNLSLASNTQNKDTCNDIKRIISRIEDNNIDRHIRSIWRTMLARCRNKSHKTYELYGGRGISVCEEWTHLKNFKQWCLNNNYKIGLTIERIDCDGNYSPQNCKLATIKEQQRNRRNNRLLTDPFDGEVLCFAAMAEKYNIGVPCLSDRLNVRKWRLEKALKEPVRKPKVVNSKINKKASLRERIISWHDDALEIGEEYTTRRMAHELNVKTTTLAAAISYSNNKNFSDCLTSEFQYKKYGEGSLYIKTKNWAKDVTNDATLL